MDEKGINNSNLSNIRAITLMQPRNHGKTTYMCITTRGHIYSV